MFLGFCLLYAASEYAENALKASTDAKAIEAGLTQDKDGHWVRPSTNTPEKP